MRTSSFKFLLLILLVSCRPTLTGKYPYSKEQLLQDSKQILYLTILTQKDTLNNTFHNEIIQFQIAAGKLKSFAEGKKEKGNPGNWKISILDKKNRIICSQYFQNSLNSEREVFSENGQIELRKTLLASTQTPLRFPYLPQMNKIQIDTLTLSLQPVTIFSHVFPDAYKLK
ncbi:MAG: hypothetical protein KGP35_03070 [Bacteroidetes bacterium]|nr:hypothetical protein [Bacteroidota bacterium]